MRWSVERRLEMIEFRLHWEGRLNRRDLVESFGISTQQASADIARYDETAPGNLVYDRSTKTYVRGQRFRAKLIHPNAADYLNELRAAGERRTGSTWIKEAPPIDILTPHSRVVDPGVLQEVLSAIRGNEAIEITYQSFSKNEPGQRLIAPHALGFDGVQWHLRAWCLRSEIFKNFSLARISNAHAPRPCAADPATDHDWQQRVEIVAIADPIMSPAQRVAIETEYGMIDGKLKIEVRRSFLLYALRRLGLDVPEDSRPRSARRLKLLDRAAIFRMAGIPIKEVCS